MGRLGKLRREHARGRREEGGADGAIPLRRPPRDAAEEGVTPDELSLLAGEVDIGGVPVFRLETLLPNAPGRKRRR